QSEARAARDQSRIRPRRKRVEHSLQAYPHLAATPRGGPPQNFSEYTPGFAIASRVNRLCAARVSDARLRHTGCKPNSIRSSWSSRKEAVAPTVCGPRAELGAIL